MVMRLARHVLRRFRQGVQHAAFPDQVAEHQETDQRHAGGGYQAGQHGDDDGKRILVVLVTLPLR